MEKSKLTIQSYLILPLKVENGKITVRDGMGNEHTMSAEYGDFGKSSQREKLFDGLI